MFNIIWLQNDVWKIFTNEVWTTIKEAEDYGKRNKFKKSVQWKVVEYDRKYFILHKYLNTSPYKR